MKLVLDTILLCYHVGVLITWQFHVFMTNQEFKLNDVHGSQRTNNGSRYVSAEWKQSRLLNLKNICKIYYMATGSMPSMLGGKWIISL